MFLEVRHVRVAEYREPIGVQRENLVNRPLDAGDRLVREAIDQIDIQIAYLRIAQQVHGSRSLFHRLDSIDGALHRSIAILYADAGPRDARSTERCGQFRIEAARIDFDGEFGIGHDRETLAQGIGEAADIAWLKHGGRASAPMDVGHGMAGLEQSGDQADFLLQKIEIAAKRRIGVDHRCVAPAEPAQRIAERNMNI